jgi:beta-glucosidase
MNLCRFSIFSLVLASIATVTIPSVAAQDRLFSNEAKQKAEALLKQMTVDEKVGQLNESSDMVMPGIATEKPDDLISNGGVGSILWQMNVKEINRLQQDVIHGYRTVFPVPLAMASSWDPSVEEQAQHLAAEDARAAGIQWTFTPMVDIARDARWGRIEELMENVYLVPFHAAEEAGAGSFMSAYMDLNEVPATGNHWLLTDVLRKEWGFQGLVLSDAFAVGSLVTHGYARDGEDAAYKAITAGVNMDMASLTYSHNLAKLVKDGKVSEKYLDEMVLPILEAKYDLGLFEHPYADESKADAILSRPEGLALERKLASRSMVLIRNENRALPLSKSLKKVAVIGPLADSKQEIEGGWTVEGSFSPGGGRAIRSQSSPESRTNSDRMRRSRLLQGPCLPACIRDSWTLSQPESPLLLPHPKRLQTGLRRRRQRPRKPMLS